MVSAFSPTLILCLLVTVYGNPVRWNSTQTNSSATPSPTTPAANETKNSSLAYEDISFPLWNSSDPLTLDFLNITQHSVPVSETTPPVTTTSTIAANLTTSPSTANRTTSTSTANQTTSSSPANMTTSTSTANRTRSTSTVKRTTSTVHTTFTSTANLTTSTSTVKQTTSTSSSRSGTTSSPCPKIPPRNFRLTPPPCGQSRNTTIKQPLPYPLDFPNTTQHSVPASETTPLVTTTSTSTVKQTTSTPSFTSGTTSSPCPKIPPRNFRIAPPPCGQSRNASIKQPPPYPKNVRVFRFEGEGLACEIITHLRYFS
uniref:Mucin-2-like n=1 Tax=Steinernema glaseri TaxID=37863 RepID=A0A1I8A232_9BILA